MNKKLKIAYMGTPEFALPALKKLVENFDVKCVYTKEPKPSNRGQKITKSPVHLFAEEKGIEVKTPKRLKKNQKEFDYLRSLNLDFIVVCAYGLILPQELLDIPKIASINIHGSLLPRWRGAAPLQRAILAGDDKTGITIMKLVYALDAGDMLLKGELPININTTANELHDDMANLGADLIVKYLDNYENIIGEEQDENLVTYANKIEKEDGLINWSNTKEEILRQFNALSIWPGVFFEQNGQNIKIKDLEITTDNTNKKELVFQCKNGFIKINKLQLPGKKPITGTDYINSYLNN